MVKQYERGVVYRFGRVNAAAQEPGPRLLVPFVDRMTKVNMQVVTMPVPSQEGITRDNVSVRVDAVLYFRVVDPVRATVDVQNYQFAMLQVAQTSLRSIIGKSELDDLLSGREKLHEGLELMLSTPATGWGVHIDRVEIKDVALPESMKRSMARQAEADRERRARIITADGELQASHKLSEAARTMDANPAALQLRMLQTVVEVAAEKNSTLVLPFPVELLRFFDRAAAVSAAAAPAPEAAAGEPAWHGRPRRWPTSPPRSSRPPAAASCRERPPRCRSPTPGIGGVTARRRAPAVAVSRAGPRPLRPGGLRRPAGRPAPAWSAGARSEQRRGQHPFECQQRPLDLQAAAEAAYAAAALDHPVARHHHRQRVGAHRPPTARAASGSRPGRPGPDSPPPCRTAPLGQLAQHPPLEAGDQRPVQRQVELLAGCPRNSRRAARSPARAAPASSTGAQPSRRPRAATARAAVSSSARKTTRTSPSSVAASSSGPMGAS